MPVRARFWKNEALLNADSYLENNLQRMQQGKAAQVRNKFGILESLELDHNPPQRNGGLFDFDIKTPAQHAADDEYRYLKGE